MAASATETDEELIASYARSGDEGALSALIERRYPEARRIARHMLRSDDLAEDAVQEAFIALMGAAARFDGSRPFAPWWKGILYNTLRKEARRRRNQEARDERFAADQKMHISDDGERRLERKEVAERVRDLPEDLREAILLRYYEGYSHREVAEILELAPGTASSRIRRGIESLSSSLGRAAAAAVIAALATLAEAEASEPPPAAPTGEILRAAARPRKVGSWGLASLAVAALALLAALPLGAFLLDEPAAPPASAGLSPAGGPGTGGEVASGAPGGELAALTAPSGGGADASVAAAASKAEGLAEERAASSREPMLSILQSDGRPAAGAVVQRRSPAPSLDLERPASAFEVPWTGTLARADADGRVPLSALPGDAPLLARGGLEGGRAEGDARRIVLAPPDEPGGEVARLLLTLSGVSQRPLSARVIRRAGRPSIFSAAQPSWVDELGRAWVVELEPGELSLEICVPGFAPAVLELALVGGQTLRRDVTLGAEARLSGELIAPRGCGEVELLARARAPGYDAERVVGRVEGERYEIGGLTPGRAYRLIARCEGLGAFADLSVEAGAVEGPRLSLGAGPQLRGRLVDARGEALPDRMIRFARRPENPTDTGWIAQTDGDGSFRFEGLPPGTYSWWDDRPWSGEGAWTRPVGAFESQPALEVPEAGLDLGEVRTVAGRSAWVEVVVKHPSGEPAPEAELVILDSISDEVRRLDAEGRLEMRVQRDGPLRLRARTATALSALWSGEPQADRVSQVELILDRPAARLELAIAGAPEMLARGLSAQLRPASGGMLNLGQVRVLRSRRDGTLAFGGLTPGAWELRLGPLNPMRFELIAGTRQVELDLRALSRALTLIAEPGAEGLVPAHSACIWWEAREDAPAGSAWHTFSGGPARLDALPAGPVEVRVVYKGRCAIHVDRPAPAGDEFRLPAFDIRGGGELSGAVEDGAFRTVAAWGPGFVAFTRCDRSGAFTFGSLPPGRYRALLLDPPRMNLDEAEFEGCEELELRAGAKETITARAERR